LLLITNPLRRLLVEAKCGPFLAGFSSFNFSRPVDRVAGTLCDMSVNDKSCIPVSKFRRRARRLRLIGVVVLALGIAGAGTLYWLRTRSPDISDDLSMQGFNRATQRQMGRLYGKSGLLIDEWADDLQRPGTQAALVAGFSVMVFAGCFYFARLLDYDDGAG
jgi:hypothetical protein